MDVVPGGPVDVDVADHLAPAEERLHALQQLAGGQDPDPHGAERLVPGEAEEVDPEVSRRTPARGATARAASARTRRAGGVGLLGDLGHGVDGAEHVGHGRDGHHPGPPAEQAVQGLQVELVVAGDRDGPDLGAGHGGHELPGHQVEHGAPSR